MNYWCGEIFSLWILSALGAILYFQSLFIPLLCDFCLCSPPYTSRRSRQHTEAFPRCFQVFLIPLSYSLAFIFNTSLTLIFFCKHMSLIMSLTPLLTSNWFLPQPFHIYPAFFHDLFVFIRYSNSSEIMFFVVRIIKNQWMGQLSGSVDWEPSLEMGGPKFKSGLRHFTAVWSWQSHLTHIA